MTLLELQDVLGQRITVTLRKDLTPEERQLIVNIAKQMINNGDLILRTEKLAAQTKALKNSAAMQLIRG